MENENEQLLAQLRERDHDLVLAAQFGQQLVEENKQVKLQVEALERQYHELRRRADQDIERVQDENAVLERTIAELKETLAVASSSKTLTTAMQDVSARQNEIEYLMEHTAELEIQLANANDARKRLIDELREAKNSATQHETLLSSYNNELLQLRNEQQVWATEKLALERRCARFEESARHSQQDTEIFESLSAELDQERREKESLLFQVEELNVALDDARATVEFLKKAVQAESRAGHLPVVEDGKSLLAEIEDRRLDLDAKHKALQEKHQGLLQKHTVEQKRLKNRIHQLTQNGGSQHLESAQRRLEARLAEMEAENKKLQAQLTLFEKRRSFSPNDLSFSSDSDESEKRLRLASLSGSGDVAVFALKQQLQDVTNELTLVKRELRTVTMIKTSETDRVLTTEARLQETEAQLDKAQRLVAHLRFQLQERPQDSKENATPLTSVAATSHSSKQLPASTGPAKEITPSKRVEENIILERSAEIEPVCFDSPAPPQERTDHHVHMDTPPTVFTQPSTTQPKQVFVRRENVNECAQQ